jgi:hypothetical protein
VKLLQPVRAHARSTLAHLLITAAVSAAAALLYASAAVAADSDSSPQYALTAGLQASYFHCDSACIYSQTQPSTPGGSTNGVALNNFTLFGTGIVTTDLKLTLAGEYTGNGPERGDNHFDLMLGIVRFEFSDLLNIWMGRFFTPSDRLNLDGPFFTNDLTPFVNQVDDPYPYVRFGADTGIAYWADVGIFKVMAGAFNGSALNSAVPDKDQALGAVRVMVDFWDKEEGYLLRSSFYGNQNVLSLGVAGQAQDGRSAWDVDGLLDRKLGNAGVVTAEFEYQQDRSLVQATASQGWFLLGSYVFPQRLRFGRLQPLVKFSAKMYDAAPARTAPPYTLRTVESDLNYIINDANALVGIYYLNQKDVLTRSGFIAPQEYGLKIQFRI